jgi:hypothetical protein
MTTPERMTARPAPRGCQQPRWSPGPAAGQPAGASALRPCRETL